MKQMLPFRSFALEAELNRLQLQISAKLWKVILEDCNFAKHLSTFREFFLLGNGEFMEALLELLESTSVRATAVTEYGKCFEFFIYVSICI